MRCIVIPAGPEPIRAEDLTAEQIVELCGGMERVRIGDHRTRMQFGTTEHYCVMVVNDNGQLLNLPTNPRATILYGSPWHGGPNVAGDVVIVGEAWVHDGDDPGIDFVDLPTAYQNPSWWDRFFADVVVGMGHATHPVPQPRCVVCGRRPNQIPEYLPENTESDLSPDEYVRSEEGTYNPVNGHFYCTQCYVDHGMPTGVAP